MFLLKIVQNICLYFCFLDHTLFGKQISFSPSIKIVDSLGAFISYDVQYTLHMMWRMDGSNA